mgnify:CR=1 FL=1
MNALVGEDIRNAQIFEFSFPLLEEENKFVAASVMVAHANRNLVPDQGLPESKADRFCDGLHDEHRLRIAKEVEVTVALKHPIQLREKLFELRIRKYQFL